MAGRWTHQGTGEVLYALNIALPVFPAVTKACARHFHQLQANCHGVARFFPGGIHRFLTHLHTSGASTIRTG